MWQTRFQRLAKAVLAAGCVIFFCSGVLPIPRVSAQQSQPPSPPNANRDAVVRAQEPMPTERNRPEQQKTAHDNSPIFEAPQAKPSSTVFMKQPKEGKNSGFDFYRDP